MQRSYAEINEKISQGKANVLTAVEAKAFIKENGLKNFVKSVDLVACSSFEMHTNALLYLNFGQTDPLIYFNDVSLNGIKAYPTGPTDIALSCISTSSNEEYSGSHIIEELVNKKDIQLHAIGKQSNVFQNKEFETWFNLDDVNQARLLLNQAINQNNIVATNSGDYDIESPMGTLIGKLENSTYNSSSFLNPLINDPACATLGVGSRVWVAGAYGTIIGQGSNHNPKQKKNDKGIPVGAAITLSAIANLKDMDPRWIRGGYIKSFGPVLYVGVGLPIPVLNEEVAESLSISDKDIDTTIVDFSIPRRTKPVFGTCSYEELRTSTVMIGEKPTLSAPLASMSYSIEITNLLKESIMSKNFYISEPLSSISMEVETKKLNSRLKQS